MANKKIRIKWKEVATKVATYICPHCKAEHTDHTFNESIISFYCCHCRGEIKVDQRNWQDDSGGLYKDSEVQWIGGQEVAPGKRLHGYITKASYKSGNPKRWVIVKKRPEPL